MSSKKKRKKKKQKSTLIGRVLIVVIAIAALGLIFELSDVNKYLIRTVQYNICCMLDMCMCVCVCI